MWLISDINSLAPKWLRQGIGGYEAKQMTQEYISCMSNGLNILETNSNISAF
jgi:hypothetical protein